jgi:hypothetical protein
MFVAQLVYGVKGGFKKKGQILTIIRGEQEENKDSSSKDPDKGQKWMVEHKE